MRTQLLFTALVALSLSAAGCVDTCKGGSNFSNVRFDPASAPSATSTVIDLRFDPGTGPGANLPASYYQTVATGAAADAGTRVTAATSPETGVLRLQLNAPLGAGVQAELSFGDRQSFGTCRHPGAPDTYYLNVGIAPAADGGGYQLTTSETVDVGPI